MHTPRVAALSACAALLLGCGGAKQPEGFYEVLRTERGELSSAETSCTKFHGRYALCTVRLQSSTGLVATGRMLMPPEAGAAVPAVLLNAGLWIGSGVVEALPHEFGDIAILSLDYPEGLPRRLRAAEVWSKRRSLLRAGRETVARFSLAGEFLALHDRVDAERVAIIGGSFAVPFSGMAAAIDDRFRNVALIYGAGELPSIAAANFRLLPGPFNLMAARVVAGPFGELDPVRHVDRIAPRHLLMINGRDDDYMPERAVRSLFDAAGEPKEIVWMMGGHLESADHELIAALVDTAFSRLPVLRDAVGRR
jgi:hypothetical protein